VHAVEEPSHGDACEEVEGGVFLFGGRGVCVVLAWKRNGGFNVSDSGLREGGEFGEVVAAFC